MKLLQEASDIGIYGNLISQVQLLLHRSDSFLKEMMIKKRLSRFMGEYTEIQRIKKEKQKQKEIENKTNGNGNKVGGNVFDVCSPPVLQEDDNNYTINLSTTIIELLALVDSLENYDLDKNSLWSSQYKCVIKHCKDHILTLQSHAKEQLPNNEEIRHVMKIDFINQAKTTPIKRFLAKVLREAHERASHYILGLLLDGLYRRKIGNVFDLLQGKEETLEEIFVSRRTKARNKIGPVAVR